MTQDEDMDDVERPESPWDAAHTEYMATDQFGGDSLED